MIINRIIINNRGSIAVEVTFVALLLAFLLFFVQKFAFMSGSIHRMSVGLQNEIENTVIDKGNPVCLEKIGKKYFASESAEKFFGSKFSKGLFLITLPICEEMK